MGQKYKSGDKVSVGMPLQADFYAEGKIEVSSELLNDAKALGCEELLQKRKRKRGCMG